MMYNGKARHAYRLECRNCPRVSMHYFDELLPDQCDRCHRPQPKIISLQTGEGYVHRKRGY